MAWSCDWLDRMQEQDDAELLWARHFGSVLEVARRCVRSELQAA